MHLGGLSAYALRAGGHIRLCVRAYLLGGNALTAGFVTRRLRAFAGGLSLQRGIFGTFNLGLKLRHLRFSIYRQPGRLLRRLRAKGRIIGRLLGRLLCLPARGKGACLHVRQLRDIRGGIRFVPLGLHREFKRPGKPFRQFLRPQHIGI